MQSLNPLLNWVHCWDLCQLSQSTLLPLTPAPLSPHLFLHLICPPSFWHPRPPLSLSVPPPLFFLTPHPPPSAFDDLSQAHGEYSKGGYGGSAQSQTKSAGSGPGKGTHTSAHFNNTHAQSLWEVKDRLNMWVMLEFSGERCVYMHACDVHTGGFLQRGKCNSVNLPSQHLS